MKKNLLFVILITLTVSLSSCAKEESLTPNPNYDEEATGDSIEAELNKQ